jgi:LPS export ABC transporter protein LptC
MTIIIKQKSLIIRIILLIFIITNNSCDVAISPKGFRPDMLVENYKTTNFKNSRIEWILKAKRASYYFDEKRSIAENIQLYYYQDHKANATVKADKAIIYTDSRDIDLIGNVDMFSTSGNKLLTQKIRWDNKNEYLDTDEPIKILRNNGDIIEGIGLRADYNLEKYEIKKKVVAISRGMKDTLKKRQKSGNRN